MVRLLLHSDYPVGTVATTRFGGLPLISTESVFQWPACSVCSGAMQFLGQIAFEDGNAARSLLLFMCQNNPGLCDEWSADLGGNRAFIMAVDSACRFADVPESGVTIRDTAYGVRVEAVDSANYSDAKQWWANAIQGERRSILGALDGEPIWLQGDETPQCDHCGDRMRFVAQLEEGPDRKTAMNFGGGGCAYVFCCSCAQGSAKFLWQCG
jgi:hypothetical protein